MPTSWNGSTSPPPTPCATEVQRLLLDSHVVLWWFDGHASLGARCQKAISEADEVFVSSVTPWELGIKRALGKIDYPDTLVETVIDQGFAPLPVLSEHADNAPQLPMHHRDPFDRMLVAQAQRERLVLVTADGLLAPYDVEILAADR